MTLINRELSILQFNVRLLAQAQNNSLPLLERLRYLCIVSSNLDEFFETRYASLKMKHIQNPFLIDECKQTVASILHKIHEHIDALVHQQYICYEEINALLMQHDVYFHQSLHKDTPEYAWAEKFFIEHIMPVLTPIGIDTSHPFPLVLNKSLNFLMTLKGQDIFGRQAEIIILPAPRSLPRLINMPSTLSASPYHYIFLSTFIETFAYLIFPQLEVTGCYQFRITRNSDVFIQNNKQATTDLRITLQGKLRRRNLQNAIRLEIAANMPNDIVKKLIQLQVQENTQNLTIVNHMNDTCDLYCYRVNGPLNLVRLLPLIEDLNLSELKFPKHIPHYPNELKEINFFEYLQKQDILLHLPYESFDPVIDFLYQAIEDTNVVSIHMTLYRTGQKSPITQALIKAAQKGKEVTVIVELLARFDEETNINTAQELERYGVHVVYGVVGYKCHAKLLLITRNEWRENGWTLCQYAQIGTGNYHSKTAKFYTDFTLFTHHTEICQEIHQTIKAITGSSATLTHKHILQSPFNLHNALLELIEQEIQNFKNKNATTKITKTKRKNNKDISLFLDSQIVIKVNSLDEPKIIQALYRASQAGVKIILVVRGICALHAGIIGLSENIHVVSTIGRFLEHHRIYYFASQDKLYIGSSDLMYRNCFRRIEILLPIYQQSIKTRIINEGLRPHIDYYVWKMEINGNYQKYQHNKNPQQIILDMLDIEV
jgi:polyphosphate kinase